MAAQDLIGFERAAYGHSPDRVERMIRALRALTTGELVEDGSRPQAQTPPAMLVARMAAAVAAVMGDPDVELSPAHTDRLMLLSNTLKNIFELSGFGGTDFLLRLLGNLEPGAPIGQINKRFALLNLDSGQKWPAAMIASAPPRLAWEVMAYLIATKPVATLEGQARREELLGLMPSMPPAQFPPNVDYLVLGSSAWMLSSYASSRGKHAIKAKMNTAFQRMAGLWGLSDVALPARREIRDRPRLLFAAEIMHSFHVQYRYFGQYLRQLRADFELVLLTEKREADDDVRLLFDSVLTFERGNDEGYLREIHRMIVDTAPDIIFYPSVGMRHWGPLFANLRLAPIQLTALGHSASTFCDTIDYYLLEEGYVSDPSLFGETVITVPDESLIFERAPGYRALPPGVRERPASLRIAFPSNALKLNPGFLSLIERIRKEASRPLELHFLPNASGLDGDAVRRTIRSFIPGAIVHGQLPYSRYLEILSSCDLNLSPFPFGGLHSVVDSLRQGLPVVAMDCPEPHGRTDAMLLRRLGMPEWLIANNEQEYSEAALRIIRDDDLRVRLSRQALGLDIDHVMFGDATTPLRTEIRDAMRWIYRHHEAAKADGRKLWSETDRQLFDVSAA